MSEFLLRGGLITRSPPIISGGEYDEIVAGFAPVSYWKFDETSGTTVVDTMGVQDATINGTPERSVPTIVQSDIDGTCIAWTGTAGEYAQAAHNAAYKTPAGTIVVTHQHDQLPEKSILVACDASNAAGGLSVEVQADGSSRAFLRDTAGAVRALVGIAGDVRLNRAYTTIFKWGLLGLSLALWDHAGNLVRRLTDPLTAGVTGTSPIRFGAWHTDVAHHDGPYGRVVWMDRRISDAEEASLAKALTINRPPPPDPDDRDQFWINAGYTKYMDVSVPESAIGTSVENFIRNTWNAQGPRMLNYSEWDTDSSQEIVMGPENSPSIKVVLFNNNSTANSRGIQAEGGQFGASGPEADTVFTVEWYTPDPGGYLINSPEGENPKGLYMGFGRVWGAPPDVWHAPGGGTNYEDSWSIRVVTGATSNRYTLYVYPARTAAQGTRGLVWKSSTVNQPNRWNLVEVEILLNDPGSSNGIIRLYLNGTLIHTQTGVALRNAANQRPRGHGFLVWHNGGTDQDEAYYYRRWKIYRRP